MVSLVGAMVVYWVLMSNFLFNTGKFIYSKYTFLVNFYSRLVERLRLCFILKKDFLFYLILIFLLLFVKSQVRISNCGVTGTIMYVFKASFSIPLVKCGFNERQSTNYLICISVMSLLGVA